MYRRQFTAALASAAVAAPPSGRFVKSICAIIFPPGMPLAEQFQRARKAGFNGIELRLAGEITIDSPDDQVKRVGDAARAAGIRVASLWASDPIGRAPLNSPDPAVREKGVAVIRKAVDFCHYLDCGAMLIVPGRLGAGGTLNVGYMDTWERTTAALKQALPYAAQKKVILAPENVWNKFLVSPRDMRDFIDQFRSPWLQVQFDIGNVMQFGFPQDWILTLGSRIKGVHIKDYKLSQRAEQGRFVDLLEGDVDWPAVMQALIKTGYQGFLSPEIGYDKDDPEKIHKVSAALDKILRMA